MACPKIPKTKTGVAVFLLVWLFKRVIKPRIKALFQAPPFPVLENTWWGPSEPYEENVAIEPFEINVSEEVLKDLQQRLENTLPYQPPLEGAKQHYGMNTNLLKDVVDFWKTKYNWREREVFLNQFPQYKVNIQGLKIHYLHVKPKEAKNLNVLPLLILHGWPGSVREFYEMIPLLTTPQKGRNFVFEVIAPSLPGFGFSDAAVRPGLGAAEMAVVFKNLMKKIGFERYYVQGGDWGAIIVQHMATLFPGYIIGLHSNMCFVNTVRSHFKIFLASFWPSLFMDKAQALALYPIGEKFANRILETGYLHIQATKPDTVGVALRESPSGLAAYILEKFTTGTNASWKNLDDGGLTKKFTYTQLLDNVMIYWVTRCMTSAIRIYAESFSAAERSLHLEKFPIQTVPIGCARFAFDLANLPEFILKEKYRNIVHISDYKAGHFAAFEVPEILAEDICNFVEKVEENKKYSY